MLACKHSTYAIDATAFHLDSKSSNIWNIFTGSRHGGQRGKIGVMQITIERKPAGQVEADALIVPVFEGRREGRFGAGDLCDSGEVSGQAAGVDATAPRAGGGGEAGPAGWSAAKPRSSIPRKCAGLTGAAVRYLKAKSMKNIAFALDGQSPAPIRVSRGGRRDPGRLRARSPQDAGR